MAAMIKYKFPLNEAIYLKHNSNGDIFMSYYVNDYKYPETLIASYIDKVFVCVNDTIVSLSYVREGLNNYFFHVRKIEIYPELNYAKVYCLEYKKIKKEVTK